VLVDAAASICGFEAMTDVEKGVTATLAIIMQAVSRTRSFHVMVIYPPEL
jgi:hypothetical protein